MADLRILVACMLLQSAMPQILQLLGMTSADCIGCAIVILHIGRQHSRDLFFFFEATLSRRDCFADAFLGGSFRTMHVLLELVQIFQHRGQHCCWSL